MGFSEEKIKRVEENLKLHSLYDPDKKRVFMFKEGYLDRMDRESVCYSGNSKAERLSNMLDDYFETVGVKDIKEAIVRIKN